jgi:hypothetical protein
MDNSIGITTVRAEYVFGQQPAYAKSTISPILGQTVDTYIRDIRGFYFYLIQNILRSKHQLVFKFDTYDPNTKLEGMQIGKTGSNTTLADIRYDTYGIGWIYRWDSNVKLMVYYAIVINESTILKEYTKDIKDNVLTIRVQYKF